MSDTKNESVAVVQWEPASATEAWGLAKYYQASSLLPKSLRNVADVFVAISAGRDFGWSPMQSMRGLYVVEGRPTLSADAMVGIAKKSAICEYFRLVESSAKIATYETKRKGDPEPTRMSFTIEEAQAAGLTSKGGPWKSYPARMLRNRCKSALCKEVYEELLFGVYEESEADEIADIRKQPQRRPERAPAPDLTQPQTAASSTVDAEIVAEPAHDAVTGEVVEEAAVGIADGLAERIGAAASIEDLTSLGSEIKLAAERGLISDAERAALGDLYKTRRKAVLVPETQEVKP